MPIRARNIRAGRTGAAGPADGADRRRDGVAVPALRRVRDRRAPWQRPGRGGAAAPPGEGAAQRADPARVRGGAVPSLPDLGRRGLRGMAVQVRPGRHPAGVQQRSANTIRALYRDLGFNVSHSKLLPLIQHSFTHTSRWLTFLAIGLAVYAVIELVESAGLWVGQRWGEYFALVATSIFLPWEVYELDQKVTWLRVAALMINLLLVIYLAWTKRLFGIRGGKKAHEARVAHRVLHRGGAGRARRGIARPAQSGQARQHGGPVGRRCAQHRPDSDRRHLTRPTPPVRAERHPVTPPVWPVRMRRRSPVAGSRSRTVSPSDTGMTRRAAYGCRRHSSGSRRRDPLLCRRPVPGAGPDVPAGRPPGGPPGTRSGRRPR